MSAPILRVEEVTGGYGAVNVLNRVSLELREGEIVTLLGSNGAGKSTLLKVVSGLIAPTGGRILLQGEEIGGCGPEQLVRMGVVMVPEGRQLFPTMTVRENLRLGGYLTRRDGATAERESQVLELFPALETRLGDLAGNLSGGQQQMVAIGRALMSGPRLLLLDEPSLGLAPLVLKEVFEAIRSLSSLGVTVLIVEQNANLTLEYAQRGYVMDRGAVEISGTAAELLEDGRIRDAYLGLGAISSPEANVTPKAESKEE